MTQTPPNARRRCLLLGAALSACVPLPSIAQASYPNRPITIVVPFAVGGPTDASARLFGQIIAEALKQPIVVDNRAGAGGSVGAAAVARSKPDGYTLLWGPNSSLTVAPALYSNLMYDPVKSFTPIGMAVRGPMILVGRANLQPNTLLELINYARAHQLSIASAGTGSLLHLTAEMFNRFTDTKMLHVPYRGGAPATVDVISGRVDLLFNSEDQVLPHIKTGALKAYAVTGSERHPLLPDVPTVSEATNKSFEVSSWFGLLAPANTPQTVVNTLSEALHRAASDKRLNQTLREMSLAPVIDTPQGFSDTIKNEYQGWASIVKEAGIVVE